MKTVPLRCIALIGKTRDPEVAPCLREIAAFLRAQDITVLTESETAAFAGLPEAASLEEIGQQAQAALVVGGDGTLLATARHLAPYGVPLVGVNQGRLGFMTDIGRRDTLDALRQLLAGAFVREQRFMLSAAVWREGRQIHSALALNDVVVGKGDAGRLIELTVTVDGEFLFVLRADGIIVATPTGSTAYALSANGPILHPEVAGIAVVPLCPHALTNRPITLSDKARLALTLVAPHDGRAHFDGQDNCILQPRDEVRISRATHSVTLLHPPGHSYFAMLREKLHWSAAPKH